MLVGAMLAMMLAAASPALAEAHAGAEATTLNVQECIAIFGDQDAAQYQVDTQYSAQDLTQAQVQYCQQLIQNITAAGAVQYGDDGEVIIEEGVAGEEGFALLPDTGGASMLMLGAGALLVAGGLLARRIAR
jgi:guanyl-specific ribonuclease Sa